MIAPTAGLQIAEMCGFPTLMYGLAGFCLVACAGYLSLRDQLG